MAEIVILPDRTGPRPPRPPGPGTAEIVVFPGVRVDYHDKSLDLSRRPGRDKAG